MEKETIPAEKLIQQELNGALEFAEVEKRTIAIIVGMGGRLVSSIHGELIFQMPSDVATDALVKALNMKHNMEAELIEEFKQLCDTLDGKNYDTIIIDSIGALTRTGPDLHSMLAEKIPEPVDFYEPPRKKNDLPRPYQRKGKFKHGWK